VKKTKNFVATAPCASGAVSVDTINAFTLRTFDHGRGLMSLSELQEDPMYSETYKCKDSIDFDTNLNKVNEKKSLEFVSNMIDEYLDENKGKLRDEVVTYITTMQKEYVNMLNKCKITPNFDWVQNSRNLKLASTYSILAEMTNKFCSMGFVDTSKDMFQNIGNLDDHKKFAVSFLRRKHMGKALGISFDVILPFYCYCSDNLFLVSGSTEMNAIPRTHSTICKMLEIALRNQVINGDKNGFVDLTERFLIIDEDQGKYVYFLVIYVLLYIVLYLYALYIFACTIR
jgi:hypothetical protein